ncbi:hypothetical protein NBH00_01515 [Paraconexibacter antarcticus]|uniref:Uncharacterized protein n=1 Tax=Paraconexibacter antarcticus TaxID=2949664 RepID=A0ABY5DS98_9ACTN|nr:hypothetical protein [Paraconexibacter antarcticus]UTI64898.1 hypothetical protein NBH00_01515 [Paraconexibacter antarcticus]
MLSLRVIRYVLPAVVTVVGIALMAFGGGEDGLEGGAAVVGAGLSIWLINFLWRVGVSGDRERDDEHRARAYFDEHGRWPDDS